VTNNSQEPAPDSKVIVTTIQPTPYPELEVVRLGRSEWRICDSSDPSRVLGYIERQRHDRFEIVWMADPMRWGYTATLEDALLAFGDSARFAGEVFTQRVEQVERRHRGRTESSSRVQLPRRSTWLESSGHSSIA
jgi:hypothetical protein